MWPCKIFDVPIRVIRLGVEWCWPEQIHAVKTTDNSILSLLRIQTNLLPEGLHVILMMFCWQQLVHLSFVCFPSLASPSPSFQLNKKIKILIYIKWIKSVNDWLAIVLFDRWTEGLTHWLAIWLTDWLTDRLTQWIDKWMNESWMNKWNAMQCNKLILRYGDGRCLIWLCC